MSQVRSLSLSLSHFVLDVTLSYTVQYLFASGHYCRGREKDQGCVVCELFEKYFPIALFLLSLP